MRTRQIVIDVPEKILLAEKVDEATFAQELRILAAVKLYELGRLSSGRAAGLAGMSRVEFLLSLGRYQAFPFASELIDLEHDVNTIRFLNQFTQGHADYTEGRREMFADHTLEDLVAEIKEQRTDG